MSKCLIVLLASVLIFFTGCQESVKSCFIPKDLLQETELAVSVKQKKVEGGLGIYVKQESSFAIVRAKRISSPGSRLAFGFAGFLVQHSIETDAIKNKMKSYEDQLDNVNLAEITKTAIMNQTSNNYKIMLDDGKKTYPSSITLKPYAYIIIDKENLARVFIVMDGKKNGKQINWANSYIYYYPGWMKLYDKEGVFCDDGERIKEICREGVNQIVQFIFDDINDHSGEAKHGKVKANYFSLWEDNDRLITKTKDVNIVKTNEKYIYFEIKDSKIFDGLHIMPKSDVLFVEKN